MALPTVDVVQVGWLASILATIKTFFSWFGKSIAILASRVIALWASSRILCTGLFLAALGALLLAANSLLTRLISYILSLSLPNRIHPSSPFVRTAFQLISNCMPIGFLFDMAEYWLSAFTLYITMSRSRLAFRWTVRAYDWLCKGVK